MFKRFAFVTSALCLTLAPLAGFAVEDAASTDPAPVDVQAPPPDAGPSDAAVPPSDVAPPADTTGTTSFSPNPCWDLKCPKETDACKADAACVAAAAKDDFQGNKLYGELANCGWKNCNDPTKGSCVGKCGKYSKSWPCNCDTECQKIGDCCADLATACPPEPVPAGSCAQSDCAKDSQGVDKNGAPVKCYCDSTCAQSKDCCADYETTCGKGGTGPCVPKCAGKKCGPDGCGKTCGVCGAGAVCDNAGLCLGGPAPAADAGGGVPGADVAGGADAGGGQLVFANAPAKTGCTAGTSAAPRAGLFVVFGALCAAVLVRRRRA